MHNPELFKIFLEANYERGWHKNAQGFRQKVWTCICSTTHGLSVLGWGAKPKWILIRV